MDTCQYDAFISYRHLPLDTRVAEKLQALLEAYRPPKNGRYARTDHVRRIFRDQSELPTSGDLGADIQQALAQSAFLIVICSPETAQSKWCLQEIAYFKELHGGSCANILTLLVAGDPHIVFPEPLRREWRDVTLPGGETARREVEVEPLAANVAADTPRQTMRLLKEEFLRIAAPLLGCSFDDLYRRHQRRRTRRVLQVSAAAIALLAAVGGYVLHSQRQIQERQIQVNSEKVMRSLNTAEDLIDDGNKFLASTLLLDTLERAPALGEYAMSELERLLYQSSYIPQYGQYAVLSHAEAVTATLWGEEALYCGTKNGGIAAWNTRNGALLWRADVGEPVVAFARERDKLYAVTQSQSVFTLDAGAGTVSGSFSYYDGGFNLALYGVDEAMIYGGRLYLLENIYPYAVKVVDLSAQKAEYLFGDGASPNFEFCCFDTERHLIVTIERAYTQQIAVYDLSDGRTSLIETDVSIHKACYNEPKGEIVVMSGWDDSFNFSILRYALDGTLQSVGFLNEDGQDVKDFYFQYLTDARISPNGRFLALGDYYGNLLVVDMENKSIAFSAECRYEKISKVRFVENECLFVAYQDAQSQCELYSFRGNRHDDLQLPHTSADNAFLVSPDRSAMGTVDRFGGVRLFSLEPGELGRTLSIDTNSIFGTHTSDNGLEPTGDEYAVAAVSADGTYRLAELLTEEAPEHIANQGNGGYHSYWVVDNKTGERLYNADLPSEFIAVDLRDDGVASVLTGSYHLYDVDMRTGEILRSVQVECPFNGYGYEDSTKFRVNYARGNILLATAYHTLDGGVRFRGIVADYSTGRLLFECSGPFHAEHLGFDPQAGHVYLYQPDETEAVQIAVPDFEEARQMAARQVDGRTLQSTDGVDIWGET